MMHITRVLGSLVATVFIMQCQDSLAAGIDFYKFQYEIPADGWSVAKRNWNDARDYCKSKNGDLSSIASEEELNYIINVLKSGRFWYERVVWIGLNDKATEGKYVWSDGSSFAFSKWLPGEPNNVGDSEDCASLVAGFPIGPSGFQDQSCSESLPFVCKIQKPNPCLSLPCKNQGTCEWIESGYKCSCASNWIGPNCEVYDACTPNPCKQGACTKLGSTSYQCSCSVGWTGSNCDQRKRSPCLTSCLAHPAFQRSLFVYFIPMVNFYTADAKSWDEAQSVCKGQGASLASFGSPEEMKALLNLRYESVFIRDLKEFWIGLNDREVEDCFVWSDGRCTPALPWSSDNKNGDVQNCVVLSSSEVINVADCAKSLPFICKKNDLCYQHKCANGACAADGTSYKCNCNVGWSGQFCDTDVNECLTSSHGCAQVCSNTAGSYSCGCREGFKLASDARSCIDLGDPCQAKVHGCEQKCVKLTSETWRCDCEFGFSLAADKAKCISNYKVGSYRYEYVFWRENWKDARSKCLANGGDLASMYNSVEEQQVRGSAGYNDNFWIGLNDVEVEGQWVWSDGSESTWKNWLAGEPNNVNNEDCALFQKTGWMDYSCDNRASYVCKYKEFCFDKPCKNGATCREEKATFSCVCTPGYRGKTCEDDVDECGPGSNACEHICVNTVGSYRCDCRPGYVLREDKRNCRVQTDICELGTHGCQHLCRNDGKGGYTCVCYDGYALSADMKSCADVNECSDANGGCQSGCQNTVGSYTCTCPADKVLDADMKSCKEFVLSERRYYVSELPATWWRSQELCKMLDGNLLSVFNAEEMKRVSRLLNVQQRYWLGLTDQAQEGKFIWADGSTSTYRNWAKNEPNDVWPGEDCAEMFVPETSTDGLALWNDQDCGMKPFFVCSLPAQPPVVQGHYRFVKGPSKMVWFDADQYCQSVGGHIISPRSDAEQKFFEKTLVSDDYWIGLSDVEREGQFKWADARLLGEFQNWATSRPLAGPNSMDCVAMKSASGWKWEDVSCSDSKSFMCKIDFFVFGGSAYYISEMPDTWAKGQEFCASLGGALASVGNGDEQNFLESLFQKGETYWLGGKSNGVEYAWVDLKSFKYSSWAKNAPTTVDGKCIAAGYFSGGDWQDKDCGDFNFAVCKVNFFQLEQARFVLGTEPLSWPDAEQSCVAQGGHLASFASKVEQDFFENVVQSTWELWIGMKNMGDGSFKWIDKSRVVMDNLNRVYASGRDCVLYTSGSGGKWTNDNCDVKRKHLCRIPEYPMRDYEYHVINEKKTWLNARRHCWKLAGELVSITGASEQVYLEQRVDPDDNYWIGLGGRFGDVAVTWSDGESYGFTRAMSSLQASNCYFLGAFGEWIASDCRKERRFVCKVPRYQTELYKYILGLERATVKEADSSCQMRGGSLLGIRNAASDGKCLKLDSSEDMSNEWLNSACARSFSYVCKISKFSASNSTYEFSEVKLPWPKAKEHCERRSGNLLSIASREEALHISSLMKSGVQYWIGYNDLRREGSFEWVDGSSTLFTSWNSGEPNNFGSDEDCVLAVSERKGEMQRWNDATCTTFASFICEIPAVPYLSGVTYHISSLRKSYAAARENCLSLGGDLTSIFSQDEQDYIQSLMVSKDAEYWLGFDDLATEGQFVWRDRALSSFRNFRAGEPSNSGGDEDCTSLQNGLWNDCSCSRELLYICKLRAYDPTRFVYAARNGLFDVVPYSQAEEVCQSGGGHLISITSSAEQDFFDNLIKNNRFWSKVYWLGLTDLLTEGSFVWTDGSPVQFTKWKAGEPSGGTAENCVVLDDGQWVDQSCGINAHYVCKSPNRCYYQPCVNLASCRSDATQYTCLCKPNFSGIHCEDGSNAIAKLQGQLQVSFDSLMSKDRERIRTVAGELHDPDSDRPCAEQNNEELFCKLKQGKDTLRNHLLNIYYATDAGWASNQARYRVAALLSWLTIHEVTVSSTGMTALSREVLELIYKLVKDNDVDGLFEFGSYVPSMEISFVKRRSCPVDVEDPFKRPISCIFVDAMKGVFDYLLFLKKGARSTKVVQTRYDLQKKLGLAKLNNIRDESSRNTLQLQASLFEFSQSLQKFFDASLGSRFAALESYFKNLAEFDRQKNMGDVDYLKSKLDKLDTDVSKRQDDLWSRLKPITIGALAAASADLAQKVAQAVLEACNIWKKITGNWNEMIDKANEAAIAGVNVIRSKVVRDAYLELINKGFGIRRKLLENQDETNKARSLVTLFNKFFNDKTSVSQSELDAQVTEFLKLSNDYDPRVQRQELAEFGSLLGAVVEEACEMLFAGTTAAAAVVQGVFAGRGDCLRTGSIVDGLMTAYNEMYDGQFEMWNTLAVVARSHVALVGAEGLHSKFKYTPANTPAEYTTEIQSLRQMSLTLILVSRIHTIQLVSQFCDYAEYMNGGEQPIECKEALRTLSDNAIDSLISLKLGGCSQIEITEVIIPTSPSSSLDTAFIDLKRLYAGDEVKFQIPDAKWLLKYRWLQPGDENNRAYYVQDLKIYLPDMTNVTRTVRVVLSTSGPAKLLPEDSAMRYYVSGNDLTSVRYHYKDNEYRCPSGNVIASPYDVCRTNSMKLCTSAETVPKAVDPSVFSKWSIQTEIYVSGVKSTLSPAFATVPQIRADLKLCILCKGQRYSERGSCAPVTRRDATAASRPEDCCANANSTTYYDPGKSSVDKCSLCPEGSKAAANGYYCYY